MAESEEKRDDQASDEAASQSDAAETPGKDSAGSDAESAAGQPQPASEGADDNDSATVKADPSQNPDPDELPEEEELTPELVEEEAIRGDFMLRWAAIFLAVLFGFTQIIETQSLVHIRAGDNLRENGFLPGGADNLAYTLEGQDVAQVSWLFDLLISFVHDMGGATGLTIFKAIVAGLIAWLLSRISVPGLPTWWSSICCVLAAAACSVDFMPLPDLATLLGITILLSLLHGYRNQMHSGLLWKVGLTMVVWANMDPRAYLGVVLLALFAVGTQFQRAASQKDGASGPNVGPLWQATLVALVALVVHPSPVASLTSAVTTYATEYPAMASLRPLTNSNGATLPSAVLLDGRTEYFPLWSPPLYEGFEFAYVAGLTLIGLALVVLVISRSRDDLPWTLPLLGFLLLAIIAVHELPAASLVAAVAAGTTAQRWYRRSFRQEYSVRTTEVLFSRGGRAVTVLAFAVLAFFVVADRLPTRAPIGVGFEADLATTIDSLGRQLEELPEDAQVFNTVLSQGDLLIWHGRKSFIDSRTKLFGQPDEEGSVLDSFDQLRWSLVQGDRPQQMAQESPAEPNAVDPLTGESQPGAVEEEPLPYDPNWKSRLGDLGVTHTMIRLAPPGPPAYGMARRLLGSPQQWRLTQRGPSALFFALVTDGEPPTGAAPVHELAFRQKPEVEDVRQLEFAREPDFYQKYIYASRRAMPESLREAQHFLELDSMVDESTIFQVASAAAQNGEPIEAGYYTFLGNTLAGPLLAIRHANETILANPNNAQAHRLLGAAYQRLNTTEQVIGAGLGGSNPVTVRLLQAIMAYREAVRIRPEDSASWKELYQLHGGQGRHGLALECLNKFLALEEDALLADPAAEQELTEMYNYKNYAEETIEKTQEAVDEAMKAELPEDPQQKAEQIFSIVASLYNNGMYRIALSLINDHLDLLRQLPQTDVIRGQILLESGELEDGFRVLNQLAAFIAENPQNPAFAQVKWHMPVAMSRLAKADYAGASSAWGDNVKIFDMIDDSPQVSRQLMQALPLVAAVESSIGGRFPAWPLMNIQSASMPLNVASASRYEPEFLRAVANIEAGNLANARFILEGLITEGGVHPLRPLAEVYFYQLSDDAGEVIREMTVDPWEEFEFPDSDEDEAATSGGDEQTSEATSSEAASSDAAAAETESAAPSESSAPSPSETSDPADTGTSEPTSESEQAGDSDSPSPE